MRQWLQRQLLRATSDQVPFYPLFYPQEPLELILLNTLIIDHTFGLALKVHAFFSTNSLIPFFFVEKRRGASGGANITTFSELPGRVSPINCPAVITRSSAAARAEAQQLLTIVEDDERNPIAPTPSLSKPNSATASLTSKAALAEVYSALKRRADQAVMEDPELKEWTKTQAAKYQ